MNNPLRLNTWRTILFTAFALIAFASNSVLNRLALGGNTIDAGSYIGIRLLSGALTLWLINGISKRNFSLIRTAFVGASLSRFLPAFYLFAYGVAFSFAYLSLSSGMGAFILFGTVQTTMLSMAILRGERPHISEWLGLIVAIGGLIFLVLPGLSAPDPLGALLMILAGVSWAFYTLKGRGIKDPLETTALNFILSVPMVLTVNALIFLHSYFYKSEGIFVTASGAWQEGVAYAFVSGALTSGVGYAIWYAALKGLKTTQAALLQLLVPIIAAVGGIIFLSESITSRLIVAGLLIITGIVLALLGKRFWKFYAKNGLK